MKKISTNGMKNTARLVYTVLPQEGLGFSALLFTLGVAVFASAMAVVYYKHHSRQLFAQLQGLQHQIDELHVEWTQLLLEQGAWATNARVEKIARERLHMRMPAPEDVIVIR